MNQPLVRPAEKFVAYALGIGAIELTPEGRLLKNGRRSPYFFNSGLFTTGEALTELSAAYAETIVGNFIDEDSVATFDLLYGPPYKGTILAPAVAMSLHVFDDLDTRFCTSRKEAKDHGEGGSLIGSPIEFGHRVLIIDDVITSGETKREAVDFIRRRGGVLAGLVIGFDRQELAEYDLSAVQEFTRDYGVPVHAIATLADLISVLRILVADNHDRYREALDKILAYREVYGVF